MSSLAGGNEFGPEDGTESTLYKKDFWGKENLKYSRPHYRMEKAAHIINRLAKAKEYTLLDIGCGPATLMSLLRPNIRYHGIDIALHESGPNLIEVDFLEVPIRFEDKKFDIIIAQGVFEYVGGFQSQKFAEVAGLLNPGGIFIVSYVNFDHRCKAVYWPYSNVQPFSKFRKSLAEHFEIRRFFPTSYNWNPTEPNRRLVRGVNMRLNVNIPFIAPLLAVEYFMICSARGSAEPIS